VHPDEDPLVPWSFVTAVLITCSLTNVHFSIKVFQSAGLKNDLQQACWIVSLGGGGGLPSSLSVLTLYVSSLSLSCGSLHYSRLIFINLGGALIALPEDLSSVSMTGSSQPPVTPASGDTVPSFYLHGQTLAQVHVHMMIFFHKALSPERWLGVRWRLASSMTEFSPWTPRGGRRELTPGSYLLLWECPMLERKQTDDQPPWQWAKRYLIVSGAHSGAEQTAVLRSS